MGIYLRLITDYIFLNNRIYETKIIGQFYSEVVAGVSKLGFGNDVGVVRIDDGGVVYPAPPDRLSVLYGGKRIVVVAPPTTMYMYVKRPFFFPLYFSRATERKKLA